MQHTILVIEDNEEMCENIEEILELSGYEVLSAHNGKSGAKLAIEKKPDLIICDVMMPVMDGYETLYILNQNEKTAGIPFVFLTAKSEKTDWRKGMNLGADDYLTKPFEEMELLRVVETRLRKKNYRNEKQSSSGKSQLDKVKSIDELKNCFEDKDTIHLKKKNLIFREGDLANFLYFLKKGKVRTFRMNEDSKEYTLGLYKEGDFFGAKTLLYNIAHPESAIALEEVELLKVRKEDFLSLICNNLSISNQFVRMISGDLLEKEKELLDLAYNSVRQRVADALLLLQKNYHHDQKEYFTISIPRDNLASIVGTSTESVIRVLSDFKEEGLVSVKASRITVLDQKGLSEVR